MFETISNAIYDIDAVIWLVADHSVIWYPYFHDNSYWLYPEKDIEQRN